VKHRTVLFSIGILALLVLIYILSKFYSEGYFLKKQDKFLLPGFDKYINEIDEVEISSTNNSVTLHKNDNKWLVANKYDYEADVTELRDLLLILSDCKVVEEKTSNQDRLKKLGLNKENTIHLKIVAKNSVIADISVGKTSDYIRGTYVLINKKPNALLVSKDVTVSDIPLDWINNKIFSIDSNKIDSVSIINHKNKDQLDFILDNSGNMVLKNNSRKQSEQLKDKSNVIAALLEGLTVSDVLPIDQLERYKLKESITAKFITKEKQLITINFVNSPEGTWAIIKSDFKNDRANNLIRKWAFKFPYDKYAHFLKPRNYYLVK
jgi:hypothetical protein